MHQSSCSTLLNPRLPAVLLYAGPVSFSAFCRVSRKSDPSLALDITHGPTTQHRNFDVSLVPHRRRHGKRIRESRPTRRFPNRVQDRFYRRSYGGRCDFVCHAIAVCSVSPLVSQQVVGSITQSPRRHPPGGATALLACTNTQVYHLSWVCEFA